MHKLVPRVLSLLSLGDEWETELRKTSKEFRKLRYFDSLFFFLGGAINSARSFVTSWLSELTQSSSEQNEKETGKGKAPEEKSEAKIDEEKNAGLQE